MFKGNSSNRNDNNQGDIKNNIDSTVNIIKYTSL